MEWDRTEDAKLHRFISYLNSTGDLKQVRFAGDSVEKIRFALYADSDLAGDRRDCKSRSCIFCVWWAHTRSFRSQRFQRSNRPHRTAARKPKNQQVIWRIASGGRQAGGWDDGTSFKCVRSDGVSHCRKNDTEMHNCGRYEPCTNAARSHDKQSAYHSRTSIRGRNHRLLTPFAISA